MNNRKPTREDISMKYPALLHLARLGYRFVPRREINRDPRTNILPEALRTALERNNGTQLSDGDFSALMSALQTMLNRADSGFAFHRALTEGCRGLRLLDFDHPENNLFQIASEMACSDGKARFLPDITVYVNGLPLAMIELKAREARNGIREEYERMRRRFGSGQFRRFLQATQLWIFSNGQENRPETVRLQGGCFFAAASEEDFPMYGPPARPKRSSVKLSPLSRETEQRILCSQELMDLRGTRAFRQWRSPQTPAHRLLTFLLAPERFLFVLRYGVFFRAENGEPARRYMLDAEQLNALFLMRAKCCRGYRNWTIPLQGHGGRRRLAPTACALVRDWMPTAQVLWVERSQAGMEETAKEFLCQGAPMGEATLLSPETGGEVRLPEKPGKGRRVLFLSIPAPRYETEPGLRERLRKADPDATLIALGSEELHEGGAPLYFRVHPGGKEALPPKGNADLNPSAFP